jgi:hypothetical protein
MALDPKVRSYLAKMGRQGGRKSRRALSSAQAREMVCVREARRAYRDFYATCFWSFDPHYRIEKKDIPWVVQELRKKGGRDAWEVAARLCR